MVPVNPDVPEPGGAGPAGKEEDRIHAALRASEERYRSLFERIDEGFCIIEMIFDGEKAVDYRFVEVNPAFVRHTGIAHATGRRIREIAPDLEEAWFQIYGEVARTGQSRRFQASASLLDNRWFDVNAFPIDEPGQLRVAVVFSDITERRRIEQALREIEEQQRLTVELAPALLWWADPAGRNLSVHYGWQAYTGQPYDEMRDAGWLDAMHPDDLVATRAAFAQAFATGEPLEQQRRIRQSGHGYRWHLIRQIPIRDARGAITRWFGAAIDIHDLSELEARQHVLVGELQHRTRNLMGVIRAMADWTGEASLDLADFRARFRDRLEALARVQGLLSRLDETHRIAFDELIGTELAAMNGIASGQVILDGPAGIRLRSSTVQMLAMALHELATNAIKHGALGQPQAQLAIRWSMDDPERDGRPWLHVDWCESGVILPADALPKSGGQGRELIEKALPYQLKANTTFEIGADGVHCTISIPVSQSNVRG